jgi:putative colanic acid biosysnthesis UDP-glucose lipid carrier transferase
LIQALNIASRHINLQTTPETSWHVISQNGIIRSFVASRKKYLFFKRCFDVFFSSLAILLVMSWLLAIVALAIKLDSRGPVFFRQKRIGRNGRSFLCIKFRTMIKNKEADERPAEEDDDRITKTGKILRRINIDELPQLFNVFMGQMSMVGPRPHMLADCIRFSFVIHSYQFRSLMRPGITGWAQVNGFHGPTSDYESISLRYYWDAQYVRKANFWLDIKIIWTTAMQMFKNIGTAFRRSTRKITTTQKTKLAE